MFATVELRFGAGTRKAWRVNAAYSIVQFVRELGEQYAPVMTKTQANASFEIGRLIDNSNGSAVYIFLAAFDSLAGSAFRFEFTDSTVYCKSMEAAVPEATRAADQFGRDIRIYSDGVTAGADEPVSVEQQGGESEGSSGSDSKLWAFGVVAAVGTRRSMCSV